jgi:DHA2 family multidrug resistance protein
MWESRQTLHHAQLAEAINQASPGAMAAISQLQANGLSSEQAYGVVNRLIDQQSAMLGANDLFRISAILFLLLIPVIWLARPVRAAAPVDAGGAH